MISIRHGIQLLQTFNLIVTLKGPLMSKTVELSARDIFHDIHDAIEQKKYLIAVDMALRALDSRAEEKFQRKLLRMGARATLLHSGQEVPEEEPALDLIFKQDLPPSTRRFAAIVLLRALAGNPNLFSEAVFRNRSFILFDAKLPDLYKDLQIDAKGQTHEKEVALRSYVRIAESEVDAIFRPLERTTETRWETIASAKYDLSRLIRKYDGLLKPFLPKELVEGATDNLFLAVREYVESDDSSALSAYQRTTSAIAHYLALAGECPTMYSQLLSVRLASVLGDICRIRFETSGAGKPARLQVRPSEKKYPLHSVGRQINLGIVLENQGPGYAQDVTCNALIGDDVDALRSETFLGNLAVGKIAVDVPIIVRRPTDSLLVEISWSWRNFDNSIGEESNLLELLSQPAGVDWDALLVEEPYKLEPVTTDKELVGRGEILAQLTARTSGDLVGSSCIWGQRRVGKTSIAKTLKTRLSADPQSGLIVIFVEAGEYVHPNATKTIEQLGAKLCRQVRTANQRLRSLERPHFDGALSPISDFFDDALEIVPGLKVLIILDEFDLVPVELYRRGPTGDAFFATIRSLSQKGNMGFVLVGGERMRYLFDCQGQALNKFQMISVDYFDRAKYWTDYQDLVTRPTKGVLQFTDSALLRIYRESAGNPYYSVLICRSLFTLMVSRRDAHVTEREVAEAVILAVNAASITNFQHFWDDGIVETGPATEDVSMRRRFVLLALAEMLDVDQEAARPEIAKAAERYGLDSRTVSNELDEFVQRGVLIETDKSVACKVPLFARWLQAVGPRQISTTYTEGEAIRIQRETEERNSVSSQEVSQLVNSWPHYKGRRISAEDIRAWLEQLRSKSEQRLMFRILQTLHFYSEDEVRHRVRDAHGIVTRGLVDRVAHKQVKRWQSILVSYLDGPGKSGSRFAKLYIDENGMFNDSVVEKSQLLSTVQKREDVQAVVFVDDFVGTGRSACDYFDAMPGEFGQMLKAKGIKCFFVSIVAFSEGLQTLQEHLDNRGFEVRVHACERLGEEDVCFGPKSRTFQLEADRDKAREIAMSIGRKVCKAAPLGFGDSQALVVFSHNCPNNTLPLLTEGAPGWSPLFRRD